MSDLGMAGTEMAGTGLPRAARPSGDTLDGYAVSEVDPDALVEEDDAEEDFDDEYDEYGRGE